MKLSQLILMALIVILCFGEEAKAAQKQRQALPSPKKSEKTNELPIKSEQKPQEQKPAVKDQKVKETPAPVAQKPMVKPEQKVATPQHQKTQPQPQKKLNLKKEQKKSKTLDVSPIYCGRQAFIKQNIKSQTAANTGSDRLRLVSTMYGFDMYVDAKDYSVSNLITATGTWEPQNINLIGHIVKPGHNVLNLGSQSGLQALVMGKIIGPEGKLFIFEPYTFSHNMVTKNIELNGLQDITTIYKLGVSDEKSQGVIQVFYSNTGGSEITPINAKINGPKKLPPPVGETQTVELNRADALLPPDIKLDFALIDVQKMQVKALKGMKQIIDRSPNLVIMTEWQYESNRLANKEETTELLDYLKGKGYKIYMYTGGDIVRCKVGTFYEVKEYQELFRMNLVDLFLFPSTVPLPQ